MSVIEVRPWKKFKGAWVALEAPGVEPAFAAPDAKRKTTDYASLIAAGETLLGPEWLQSQPKPQLEADKTNARIGSGK